MQIYKKTFFQRVDFRENFNNCGNVALNLSTGSKYCIGDNQMRVAKTGKFSRRDKLSHHKMFWFACSVVCKMPLTVAARTITNLLRTNFHLCDGCFSCCRISVFIMFGCVVCKIWSFDLPQPGVIFSSSLSQFPPSKLMGFICSQWPPKCRRKSRNHC